MSRPRRRRDKESQEFVDNMMYLLTAPRIVAPGNTYTYQVNDNIGKSLIHRLAEHKEIFENEECTEFEAMIYLSTISLEHGLSHDYAEIYFYLFRRCFPEQAAAIEIEGADTLTKYPQQEDLSQLRKSIFKLQMRLLKSESPDFDQAEVAAEAKEIEDMNPRMF